MRRAPAEFADLLTARGKRILAGKDPEACGALAVPQRQFLSLQGVVDEAKAKALRDLMERALLSHLVRMEQPIPPQTIVEMTENYGEILPKTARVQTAYLDHPRARSYRAAEEIGLTRMLTSESFGRFAAALAGRPLRKQWGMQVLCYGAGDYAGPHNDHHPEDAEARGGYIDVHLSLCTPQVAHHFLVYARRGHFSHMESVATVGGITAYRLPFWHYTTPLVAQPGHDADARRWLLLGTFLYATPRMRETNVVRPPEGMRVTAPPATRP